MASVQTNGALVAGAGLAQAARNILATSIRDKMAKIRLFILSFLLVKKLIGSRRAGVDNEPLTIHHLQSGITSLA
jgi:hypothetical protein